MNKTIAFVSLGCDKNTVDSEIMLQLLTDHGYTLIKEEEKAKILVVNTCAFIQDAKEESINTIIELGEYKKTGACRGLIVTGCLAQRYAKEIFEELPEVDAVVGTGSYEEIVQVADRVLEGGGEKLSCLRSPDERALTYQKRIVSTVGYYEYLKSAEGCDHHCTYCIIPKLRGRYRSRTSEDIRREAEDLAEQGVKELMIIAQDITKYGRDIPGEKDLPELLQDLCTIPGLQWIRLLYCYPEDITEKLMDVIAREPKIVPYLDMPIQHASDSVLRRMGRRDRKENLRQRIRQLRERIPGVALRTTLITGFPGETEEEFRELCDFVKESRFDRLGVFAYSQEEDTPAAAMENQIPQEVKEARRDTVMELQRSISMERSQAMVGLETDVLIEGRLPEEENVYTGRTYRDAPEIDGFIFVTSDRELRSGDMIRCRVTGAYEYDLIGEEIEA